MIHLDTNFLIGVLTAPSPLSNQIANWLTAGEKLAMSAVAWSEFKNGPNTAQQVLDAEGLIEGRVVPFDVREAEMAAKLFNLVGRKRSAQVDCFIAATAVCARIPLATLNRKDFTRFAPAGLKLAVP